MQNCHWNSMQRMCVGCFKALQAAQFLLLDTLQIWSPVVGEVVERVNPECSSLQKLCWSLKPSQLICSLPAGGLFPFKISALCCYFTIMDLFSNQNWCDMFTLRSAGQKAAAAALYLSKSKSQQQELCICQHQQQEQNSRLPCFFFSSCSPPPCQGPASAE